MHHKTFVRDDAERDTDTLEAAMAFDDTAVLVTGTILSVDVGGADTDRMIAARAITADEWPPEPPQPAMLAPRRARFYPVVRRPTTCTGETM